LAWALVTGAARRLGRVLAVSAARAGYDVVIHHRIHHGASPQDAEETLRLVREVGREGAIAGAELTDPASAPALIAASPGPLTLLVNCASVFGDDTIETLTPLSLELHWLTNLRAPVLLAQAFAAALPKDGDGLIVNIIDQRVWRLTPRNFSYTLTKAALWTATQTLAQALAPAIRVNAIGPGPTLPSVHQGTRGFAAEAAAVPLGRGPDPEEIGAALAYLIDARSVTGQMIAVDGGQHLSWRTPDVIGG
jgi:NAD(P)-dependent dehydrogenase (short-subunit alcohol dehydrogenase family)